jgi:hypothetical protein
VRATILALTGFAVAAKEPAGALGKAWSAYRKTVGLDLYGHAQRQIRLDSQDACTPMNGKAMTDLIQPIARTESLSRDAGL